MSSRPSPPPSARASWTWPPATIPTAQIVMDEGKGPRTTVGVILAQLVHHGNEHRTQVTTILGATASSRRRSARGATAARCGSRRPRSEARRLHPRRVHVGGVVGAVDAAIRGARLPGRRARRGRSSTTASKICSAGRIDVSASSASARSSTTTRRSSATSRRRRSWSATHSAVSSCRCCSIAASARPASRSILRRQRACSRVRTPCARASPSSSGGRAGSACDGCRSNSSSGDGSTP